MLGEEGRGRVGPQAALLPTPHRPLRLMSCNARSPRHPQDGEAWPGLILCQQIVRSCGDEAALCTADKQEAPRR